MKFHPNTLSGIDGSSKLLSVIRGYFRYSTGFQIQFNVVDSIKLRDAQQHPENYRDLIVRVAGFSAYFVELSKSIQDEVITRTEHMLDTAMPDEPRHAVVGLRPADDNADVVTCCHDDVIGTVFDIQDMSMQDGPGLRTSVFLKGCQLRCTW